MAKAKHTYAVRLAVEGGNKVKANLTSVGTSGERSIKKIDRASDKASRGLSTLGDRASGLRSRMRLLGGVVAGIAAGGGIALLINRSIAAADSIGKLSGAIGVGTDTLQELRYAAGLAGVSTGQLDGAMVAFSKRVGEARSGTGTLITLLQKMDPALLANVQAARTVDEAFDIIIRRASALGNTLDRNALLAAAFGRTVGPLMANLIRDGVESLDRLRQRAHDLGIVLDEEMIRNAERAKDEMDTLGQVLSANVTRAVLGLAPALADLSTWLSNVAVDAGDSYERLKLIAEGDFNFEDLSLGATRREVEERKQEMIEIARELKALPEENDDQSFWEWLWGTERENLTEELQKKVAIYRQWAVKLAWMQAEAERRRADRAAAGGGDGQTAGTTEDEKAAQERAQRLLQIEKSLNNQLFQLRHQGADRIRAEHAKLETELEEFKRQLAEPLPAGGTEAEFEKVAEERARQLERIERLQFGAAAVRDDKLTQLDRREKERGEEKADRVEQANKRVVENLGIELEALKKTERQRFVDVALRRLSAEAIPKQREEVEKLAGALYEEQQAMARREEARALTERLRTAQEAYGDEIERLRELLDAGAIDQETFARASEQAYDRMLDASRKWSDGVRRAIRDYVDEATDAAKQFERVTTRALQASEDAFVQWAQTGKFSAKDLFNTIAEEALRAAYRMAVAKPLNDIFNTIFSAIAPTLLDRTSPGTIPSGTPVPSGPIIIETHTGGVIGHDAFPTRMVDPRVFDGASRYHRGGIVGGEVPVVARAGEGVFTPGQMRSLAPVADARPTVNVAVNVRNTAPGTQASADVRREPGGDLSLDIVIEQVEGGMARHIGRGEGLAPTLERRYGLNPAAGSFR